MAKAGKSLYSLTHKRACAALRETNGRGIGNGFCVCADTPTNREILDKYNVVFGVTNEGLRFFV